MSDRELGLDAAQKQRLALLLNQQRASRDGHSDPSLQTSPRQVLGQLMSSDHFDRVTAQTLIGQRAADVQRFELALMAAFGDFFDGLQVVQQVKLRELLAAHQELMPERTHKPRD